MISAYLATFFRVVRPPLLWPWDGSNYPSRSCNGLNGPKRPKFEQNRLKTVGIDQPVRPFVLSTRDPPSPNALRNPDLVDVAHRNRGDLELPAGQLAAAKGRSHSLFALVAYLMAVVLVCPRDVHFSQDHCYLIPYPIAPQWSEQAERASIQQQQQQWKLSVQPFILDIQIISGI